MGLCTGCRDLAEEALLELPALFEQRAIGPRPDQARERAGRHRPRGTVLRDAVVSARSGTLGVLAAWCRLVTAERGVRGPDEFDIHKLVGFLAIHLHWLCGHPAAPDFADELADQLDAANDTMRPGLNSTWS